MSNEFINSLQHPPPLQGMTEAELLAIFDEAQASESEAVARALFVAPVELIEMYRQQTPGRIDEMRSALVSGDWPLLARAAHTLKGNSTYVAADAVGKLGGEIERCVDDGKLEGVGLLINALEAEFLKWNLA